MPYAMPWRMNLLEVSQIQPSTFYLATDDEIFVFDNDPAGDTLRTPSKSLKNPNHQSSVRYIDSPYKINAIKVGFLNNVEILVSVAENGQVCVWRTANLDIPPIVLKNEASTWGIAIHSERRLIAVSANNFEITVFNMVAFPPDQQEDTKEFKSILGTDSQCRLVGHEHNVPNIDFSGCGRFIKRKTICQRKFVFLGRGSESWSVAYSLFSSLKGDAVKSLYCDHEPLRQAMKGRPSYGKETLGLSYFGVQHTAGAPLFLIDAQPLDFDVGGFDLEGAEDGYEDYENHPDDDEDWTMASTEIQQEDYLDGVTPEIGSQASDSSQVSSRIDIEELDDSDLTPRRGSSRRRPRSTISSGSSTPHSEGRYGVESAVEHEQRQENRPQRRNPQTMSARQAAIMRQNLSLRRPDRRQSNPFQGQADIDDETLPESGRSGRVRQFLARALMEDTDASTTLEDILFTLTNSGGSRQSPESSPPTAASNPITPGGWSDDQETADNMNESQESDDTKDSDMIIEEHTIYPDEIPRPFVSSNVQLDREEKKVKLECICKTTYSSSNQCTCPAGNDFPDELVVLTTGRNIYLMNPKERLKKLAVDKNILADIDLRTDRMLCIMDRLNMTEWIPELELLIIASQKGMVALIRVLRIDLGDEEEEYVFNREAYLPHAQLSSSPLYGK
ncbi:hypothetical protein VKS41_005585 [Umbelopsis sp. WA50703]